MGRHVYTETRSSGRDINLPHGNTWCRSIENSLRTGGYDSLIAVVVTVDLALSYSLLCMSWASLVAQMIENRSALWETWVRCLGQEDPLGKGMATHSSILAWRIPWTVEPGGLQSMGSPRVRYD